ncbi:hypothetical protein I6F35_06690 [Bradyrhizobium sp. BRP22]|nr:hypothetical protein [Bradyrhizobium sp. BRP22]MCA1452907.1 hypothetical protein [Bradyrhizobium sp. BRP22]
MSVQDQEGRYRSSPTGPRVAPPRQPIDQRKARPPHRPAWRWSMWSIVIFVLLISSVGIRAYRDLSEPAAWAYWKDQYLSPSLSSRLITKVDLGGPAGSRPALAISGRIGPAAANWFRDRLDEAHLAPGDLVLLSSPGGDLNQALIMGEIIRSRGLTTAVGVADASGRVRPAYCASACVLAYAGGTTRYGIEGSMLGVHRFVTTAPVADPVADTQRITGAVLHYMTKMGVSSSVIEAMSQTRDIRWLGSRET